MLDQKGPVAAPAAETCKALRLRWPSRGGRTRRREARRRGTRTRQRWEKVKTLISSFVLLSPFAPPPAPASAGRTRRTARDATLADALRAGPPPTALPRLFLGCLEGPSLCLLSPKRSFPPLGVYPSVVSLSPAGKPCSAPPSSPPGDAPAGALRPAAERGRASEQPNKRGERGERARKAVEGHRRVALPFFENFSLSLSRSRTSPALFPPLSPCALGATRTGAARARGVALEVMRRTERGGEERRRKKGVLLSILVVLFFFVSGMLAVFARAATLVAVFARGAGLSKRAPRCSRLGCHRGTALEVEEEEKEKKKEGRTDASGPGWITLPLFASLSCAALRLCSKGRTASVPAAAAAPRASGPRG